MSPTAIGQPLDPGSIVGTVVDSTTTRPLKGVCADAFAPGSKTAAGHAVTDANGAYRITSLERGSYLLRFTACEAGAFRTVWWSGTPFTASTGVASSATATLVPVSARGTAAGRDMVMEPGEG